MIGSDRHNFGPGTDTLIRLNLCYSIQKPSLTVYFSLL